MTFETDRRGRIVCRLILEEAERAVAEGYLTIMPEEDRQLVAAVAEARQVAARAEERNEYR